MINWTPEQLKKLKEHYEGELQNAEEAIEDSSFPQDEQRQIDCYEDIIGLINNMMDEKSWVYKLTHKEND